MVVEFLLLFLTTANACTQSGWSIWINDRIASSSPLPGEENSQDPIIPGGDRENMNASARDQFCASGHGVITNIRCVTVANETSFTDAQTGKHAMSCEIANGFTCLNRYVDGHVCLDYKISLFCNCTSHNQTPKVQTTPGIGLGAIKIRSNTTSIGAGHAVTLSTSASWGISAPAVEKSTGRSAAERHIFYLPACFLLALATLYLNKNA